MPDRTRLRIGQHGKISRTYVGEGVWEAKCRYRDTDGVTRQVRRRGPPDEYDRYGKLAEGVLIESLAERRPPTDEIGPDTSVCGKVVRVTGKGLMRDDETKTAAGRRNIALPRFAIEMLATRRRLPYLGEHPTIMFPSTAGSWRDPNNFGRDWRRVRAELGVPDVTTHSFRKSVATLMDDRGFSARISADQLGHARPSMTQDRYMARGKVHKQVAEALDDAISGPITAHRA